jgi:membrane fusion protein (multidrug efflux system)
LRDVARLRLERQVSLGKQILISLVLLCAAAAGGYAYWAQGAAGGAGSAGRGAGVVLVETVAARADTVEERIEAVGTTLARQAIDVVADHSGRVREIAFAPGQEVAAGAVLVRLDDELERAALTEAEAQLEEASRAFERARQLAATNSIARATLEETQARLAAAQARTDQARRRLADRTIRAPFAGRVGLRGVDVGAVVDDSKVLTTLDDLSEVEVDFTVPEIYFGRLAAGQPVLATAAAFGDAAFAGRLVTIDSRVDRATRAFRVRAAIPNPDRTLPAGMFVRVEVVLGERPAVLVPEEAVVMAGERSLVFLVEDGRAVEREVRIGRRSAREVEILEGVLAGEAVVTAGVSKIRDGSPVRVEEPRPRQPGGAPGVARLPGLAS